MITSQSADSRAFREFEHAGWQSVVIQALNAIRAAMRNAARAYEKDGVIELPMPAVLAFATKPT
ncbi:MAG: hypothetical protein HYS14_07535 [Candidatus Rokubacteria bacterium]|nr:hypothetical protein [Candidatus Rokubacteria bacterium]